MSSQTTRITISRVPVPESLQAPDAWMLHGAVAAEDASLLDIWGNLDQARTAQEQLVAHRHQDYAQRILLVALDGDHDLPDPDRVLGRAELLLPLQDNTHTASVSIDVRPPARGAGVGGALFDAAVDLVREAGRTTLTTSTDFGSDPHRGPDALEASTGVGRVPAHLPGVRFARARGFALEQVSRFSSLPVPQDPDHLVRLHADAQATAGPGYRLVTWEGPCPDEWLDQFAVLATRMSTDAPLGGLDFEEDRWDGARVRDSEQLVDERGRRVLVTATEHIDSRSLVAFSEFICLSWTQEFVHQGDTLVMREHRGRRLGMLVKAANLQRLAARQPGVRRVGTWNAEENAYMLAINTEVGFRPAGGAGEWQLRLAGPPAD